MKAVTWCLQQGGTEVKRWANNWDRANRCETKECTAYRNWVFRQSQLCLWQSGLCSQCTSNTLTWQYTMYTTWASKDKNNICSDESGKSCIRVCQIYCSGSVDTLKINHRRKHGTTNNTHGLVLRSFFTCLMIWHYPALDLDLYRVTQSWSWKKNSQEN